MPRKPIQSHVQKKENKASGNSVAEREIRQQVEEIQNSLKDGNYENALKLSISLEESLRGREDAVVIYLTSMVWQVRAHQGLKHSREEIEQAAARYEEEAVRLGDSERAVQAMRIRAQLYIDGGQWTLACEHLERALTVAAESRLGRAALEILMHLSALELKMCHYLESIDYLSRAMKAIEGAGGVREEMRELSAVGHRQLCELYNTIGDGQRACDALEAAKNANSHDREELWLQELLTSRLDMRSGDADTACTRLKKVESEVRSAVQSGNARSEQQAMIELERAQAMWNHGEYAEAEQHLSGISVSHDQIPMRQAIALTRFQWAVEMGKPAADVDEAGKAFSEVSSEAENTEIQILLAAALTQAAIEIERGHYEATFESLLHIAQTAAFTQLIPFATRALVLRGQIHLAQGNYADAAQDGKDAFETFVDHVDDVSAKQAAALMLRAQAEMSARAGEAGLDENERAAYDQLLADMERYGAHHHESGYLDLGLSLARIAQVSGDCAKARELVERLECRIDASRMAHRAMQLLMLKSALGMDEKAFSQAEEIAHQNGYVLSE